MIKKHEMLCYPSLLSRNPSPIIAITHYSNKEDKDDRTDGNSEFGDLVRHVVSDVLQPVSTPLPPPPLDRRRFVRVESNEAEQIPTTTAGGGSAIQSSNVVEDVEVQCLVLESWEELRDVEGAESVDSRVGQGGMLSRSSLPRFLLEVPAVLVVVYEFSFGKEGEGRSLVDAANAIVIQEKRKKGSNAENLHPLKSRNSSRSSNRDDDTTVDETGAGGGEEEKKITAKITEEDKASVSEGSITTTSATGVEQDGAAGGGNSNSELRRELLKLMEVVHSARDCCAHLGTRVAVLVVLDSDSTSDDEENMEAAVRILKKSMGFGTDHCVSVVKVSNFPEVVGAQLGMWIRTLGSYFYADRLRALKKIRSIAGKQKV